MIREVIQECRRPGYNVVFMNRFLPQNSCLAYFYGIPKCHKPCYPLRPIISNPGTVTRPLAGWLASLLSTFLGSFSAAHLKNTQDLKEKMNEFAAQNSTNRIKLLSMDVTALFTSVTKESVVQFLAKKIASLELVVPLPCYQFISLKELCIDNNYFTFEGEFYIQKFCISMGSPLFSVLANLYMEYYETELLLQISPSPPFWLRYIDDVILAWDQQTDFQGFLSQVNALTPSIKFTTE